MPLRPELKTWRFLLAAEGALTHAATAAAAEDMDSRVGPQIKQAQGFLSGALSTLEEAGTEPGPHVPQATMIFQFYELRYTIACDCADDLGKSLKEAGGYSALAWVNPEAARTVDTLTKKAARADRLTTALVIVCFVLIMSLTGYTESHSYHHDGGVVMGILGALDTGLQVLGMFTVIMWIRRRRWTRRDH